MIETKEKLIQISPIDPNESKYFTLEDVAGRDLIAEQIAKDIEEYSQQAFTDERRTHLGASVIGHKCDAYLWFSFRWMKLEKFSGRMARLFNRGHLEEDRIIQWLRGIGMTIQQVDVDGKQIRIVDCGNHFGGSCDGNGTLPERYGPASSVKLLVEFKTSGDKGFTPIKDQGVVKSKPQHWGQMCMYGFKLGIKYALYICVNKNDDDLDIEILELDWELGKALLTRAEAIINSSVVPKKISDNPSFFECKWCPMNGVCHMGVQPDKNCRSCQFAEPIDNAEWKCHAYQQIIPKEYIAVGCDQWKALIR